MTNETVKNGRTLHEGPTQEAPVISSRKKMLHERDPGGMLGHP